MNCDVNQQHVPFDPLPWSAAGGAWAVGNAFFELKWEEGARLRMSMLLMTCLESTAYPDLRASLASWSQLPLKPE